MTGKKSPAKTPVKVKQPHGGAILQGGNPGNKGGYRPPDAFKRMCQELASSDAVYQRVTEILNNPVLHDTLYIGALKWATEHGYGKPKESLDVALSGEVTIKQEWTFGNRKVGF